MARRLSAVCLSILITCGTLGAQQQALVERVEVARLLVDVRVLDDSGRPIASLDQADFEVRIDGKAVPVEAVRWVEGGSQQPDLSSAAPVDDVRRGVATGRLIVLFVQKTRNLSPIRLDARDVSALIGALQRSEPLLAQLTPADRVAVLSLDSHLKVWTDFTNDVHRIRNFLQNISLQEPPVAQPSTSGYSLLSSLTHEIARRTYTMEDSLRVIGNALKPLPGSKTIVIFGYGFGRPDAMKRTLAQMANLPGFLDEGYAEAVAALRAARVAVFSLDITDAHHHTLEIGLQRLSADTGGLFLRTHLFADQAIGQLAAALTGHYVLSAVKPQLQPGAHRISVQLREKPGRVLAPLTYRE